MAGDDPSGGSDLTGRAASADLADAPAQAHSGHLRPAEALIETTAPPQQTAAEPAASARWELLRAIGAAVLTAPPGNVGPCEALGLPGQTGAEHTHVFVLGAPPHAAIHLGPEGKLGGEGLDRISGFWRALGLQAPEDADHLGTLLLLYAELGEAETGASSDKVRAQMRRARTALFHEHLWSWAPGYLAAVRGLGVPSVAEWAQLAEQALRAELEDVEPATMLPLALREAPPLDADPTFDETLDMLVAPVRSGMILTYPDLEVAAAGAGLGVRRGERRYALKALFEQDAAATLRLLAAHAEHWSAVHTAHAHGGPNDACSWWSARAAGTSAALTELAGRVGMSGATS